jgi:hypothetical protein
MNTFFDVDSILDVAAVPTTTPSRQEIARRIVEDSLVQKRAMYLAVNSFILQAIREMTGPEKDVLRKRAGVPSPDQLTRRAKWSLLEILKTGKPYVRVECATCHQSQNFPQPEAFIEKIQIPGDPDGRYNEKRHPVTKDQVTRALAGIRFQHCGHLETPPADMWAQIENLWLSKIEKPSARDDEGSWFARGAK